MSVTESTARTRAPRLPWPGLLMLAAGVFLSITIEMLPTGPAARDERGPRRRRAVRRTARVGVRVHGRHHVHAAHGPHQSDAAARPPRRRARRARADDARLRVRARVLDARRRARRRRRRTRPLLGDRRGLRRHGSCPRTRSAAPCRSPSAAARSRSSPACPRRPCSARRSAGVRSSRSSPGSRFVGALAVWRFLPPVGAERRRATAARFRRGDVALGPVLLVCARHRGHDARPVRRLHVRRAAHHRGRRSAGRRRRAAAVRLRRRRRRRPRRRGLAPRSAAPTGAMVGRDGARRCARCVVLGIAPGVWPSLIAFAVWGLAFGAIPPLLQTRLLQSTPARHRDAASALYTTAFNVGIGGGALVGAVLFERVGVQSPAVRVRRRARRRRARALGDVLSGMRQPSTVAVATGRASADRVAHLGVAGVAHAMADELAGPRAVECDRGVRAAAEDHLDGAPECRGATAVSRYAEREAGPGAARLRRGARPRPTRRRPRGRARAARRRRRSRGRAGRGRSPARSPRRASR